jgi:hypothetical protein
MVIVNRRSDNVERFRRQIDGTTSVLVTGFVSARDGFPYQIAACVLVGYYSRHPALNDYRPTRKLFEYMRHAVLACFRTRSIHEIVGKENRLLVQPEHPQQLIRCLKRRVSDYTWERYAERILASAEELRSTPRRRRSTSGRSL